MTGLRGEPTERRTQARHVAVRTSGGRPARWSPAAQPNPAGRRVQQPPDLGDIALMEHRVISWSQRGLGLLVVALSVSSG